MSSSDESYQDARLIRSTSVPRKNKNVVRKTVRRTIRREESPNSKCLMWRLVLSDELCGLNFEFGLRFPDSILVFLVYGLDMRLYG